MQWPRPEDRDHRLSCASDGKLDRSALLDERRRLDRRGRGLGRAGGGAQGEQGGEGGKGDLPGIDTKGRHVRLQNQTRARVERDRTDPIVQESDTWT